MRTASQMYLERTLWSLMKVPEGELAEASGRSAVGLQVGSSHTPDNPPQTFLTDWALLWKYHLGHILEFSLP